MDTKLQKLFALTTQTFASLALASTLVASFSTVTYAQDADDADENEIDEIIITGSRTGRALNKIPGAVSIIDQEAIINNMTLSADFTSLLAKTVPGYGQSKQQMERRGETLRGRTALRLLDGVPQGSPLRDGSRDNIFTEMGVIQRVEVINGPSATEGIGAAGGIINYITKSPKEMGTEFEVSTQLRSQFEDDSDSWRVSMNAIHKNESFDFLVGVSFAETGIAYDGDGKTIGIGASGSDRDSTSDNLFIKIGTDFGAGDSQRFEFSHSRFVLECQCNYRMFDENPDVWNWHEINEIPITSIKEPPLGGKASFQDFVQTTLSYTNADVAGGTLFVQYYDADQAMRFEADNSFSKQEPEFMPFVLDANGFPTNYNPLVEQSEIDSLKEGLRTSWSTDSLAGNSDLGLQVGIDIVEDTAQQRLSIQNRVWVPPMEYSSVAPFAQLSLDVDAWTFTAGLRNEDGELKVASYVSSWGNDRRPVGGGKITYSEVLPNVGAIWRVNDDWSVYASYSKGFTLPNAGIPLRNMRCSNDTSERGDPNDPINFPFGGIQPDGCPNDPAVTVNDIIDLEAIVVDNVEIGFSWTGQDGKFGFSAYESTSDFGASLAVDPVIGDFVLSRKPTEIRGFELTGSYNITDSFSLTALYSQVSGDTSSSDPNVLDQEMGVLDVSPDKLVVIADWMFSDNANLVLGNTTHFDSDINEGKGGEEHIDGSSLWDLTVNYGLSRGTVSLGVDNLLDDTYLLSTSQIVFWKNYMHGRGREVSLGYTANFN
jgi:iron complex outermembrane receptor protein